MSIMNFIFCSFLLSIQDKSLFLRYQSCGAANESLTARCAKLANEVIRPG